MDFVKKNYGHNVDPNLFDFFIILLACLIKRYFKILWLCSVGTHGINLICVGLKKS